MATSASRGGHRREPDISLIGVATAVIGAAEGGRLFLVATVATGLVLLALEIGHLPLLRYLDARRWQSRFASDGELDSDTNSQEPSP